MATPADILVIGKAGQLAQELQALEWPAALRPAYRGRPDLDLLDPRRIEVVLAERPWAAVINTAAYTEVDRAESESDAAFALNAEAPGELARRCAARGLPLLHVSTDYVFDGRKAEGYVETDPVAPASVYGRSKEAGERAIAAAGGPHVILRSSWLYGPYGKNFLLTMLRLGAQDRSLGVVDDQRGCPTPAHEVGRALIAVAAALVSGGAQEYGVFHFATAGETSWCGFAAAIFREAAARGRPIAARLQPITTAAYGAPAPRPLNSVLDTSRLARAYGIVPPAWPAALAATFGRLDAISSQRGNS